LLFKPTIIETLYITKELFLVSKGIKQGTRYLTLCWSSTSATFTEYLTFRYEPTISYSDWQFHSFSSAFPRKTYTTNQDHFFPHIPQFIIHNLPFIQHRAGDKVALNKETK